jgi:hypothetical protein
VETNTADPNYLHQLPSRPLTNWYRIYGEKVGEDRFGWVVKGYIQTAPGYSRAAKFQLLHPPNAEKQRFDELQSILAELTRRAGSWGLPREPLLISAGGSNDGSTWENKYEAPKALHALAEPIWAELDTMPPGTNYHVDFFALKRGFLPDGPILEVFDLGQLR